jgi:hypothetical protein
VNKTPFFVDSECCFCPGNPGFNFTYLFSVRCGKLIKSGYYCGLPLHEHFYLWASGTEKYSAGLLCHHPNGECVLMPNLRTYCSMNTVVEKQKKIAICSLILLLSSKMLDYCAITQMGSVCSCKFTYILLTEYSSGTTQKNSHLQFDTSVELKNETATSNNTGILVSWNTPC